MGTVNTNANVNVRVNGVQELNNLQNKLQGVTSGFGGLRTALGGLAFTSVIAGVLKTADAIVDLSEATGLAIPAIEGFKKAVIGFGVSSEGAEKGILRLVNSIGEAAGGSAELQYLFGKVGISLGDLATMSEQQIFEGVIRGLDNVKSASERSIIVSALLGKEFRGLSGNTQELIAAYEAAKTKAEGNEAATRASAQAFDNLQIAVSAFVTAITIAISPITEFVGSLDAKALQEFANEIVAVIAIAAGFALFGKIVSLIEGFIVVVAAARAGTMALSLAFTKFFILGGLVAAAVYAILSGLKLLTGVDLIKPIVESVNKAMDAAKELFGFEPDDKLKKSLEDQGKAAKESANKTAEAGKTARNIVDPFKSLKEQIKGVAEEFGRLNKQNIDSINLQTQLIGATREENEVRKASADIANKAANEINKLTDQKAKLTKEQQAAGLGGIIDAQIAKIKEQAAADTEATAAAIKNSQDRIRAIDLEKFAKQSQIDVERDLRRVKDDIAKSTMSEMERKEYDILAAARERAQTEIEAEQTRRGSLLTDQEKLKYYEAAKKGTQELINAEREGYNQSRTFATGWKNAFRDYIDNATNAAKRAESIFRKATSGMEDLIVNFAKTGKFEWKNFVAMMLEELLRAQIQQIFASLLGGMKDTMTGGGGGIMGAIGGLFGGGGNQQEGEGGGFLDSIMSGIGSLFGGGGGGTGSGKSANDPIYVYDVGGGGGMGGGGILGGGGMGGGQQGGGIFSGISSAVGKVWDGIKSVGGSVISGIGNAVSGVWEGIKSVGGSVIDGISGAFGGISDAVGGFFGGGGDSGGGWMDSVASTIGDFFGGFFANGGMLGAGKFGVAGENGPEFISGPATITPMGGGANVTYNINAVDAMSFKQMLAQDPSFIYGLSMQGSKGVAARR